MTQTQGFVLPGFALAAALTLLPTPEGLAQERVDELRSAPVMGTSPPPRYVRVRVRVLSAEGPGAGAARRRMPMVRALGERCAPRHTPAGEVRYRLEFDVRGRVSSVERLAEQRSGEFLSCLERGLRRMRLRVRGDDGSARVEVELRVEPYVTEARRDPAEGSPAPASGSD